MSQKQHYCEHDGSDRNISADRTGLSHDSAGSGNKLDELSSRFIPNRHRPRAELYPAHEPQVDMLR